MTLAAMKPPFAQAILEGDGDPSTAKERSVMKSALHVLAGGCHFVAGPLGGG